MRFTPQRRQQLLGEFDRSGLSAPRFAEVTGLKYQTLAAWLQKRRMQRDAVAPAVTSDKEPAVQWLETVIEQAQGATVLTSSALMVRLPSGATLEVANVAQVSLAAAVLRAWESPGGGPPC